MHKRPRRFRRYFRRCFATLLGFWLGWQAAAVAFNQVPITAPAADRYALNAPAGDETKHGAGDATKHDEHDAHATPGSVRQLVPGEGQTDWYAAVVWGAVLLFVAAALIGVPLMKLLPPEPQASPDHHDDHGGHGGHDGDGDHDGGHH